MMDPRSTVYAAPPEHHHTTVVVQQPVAGGAGHIAPHRMQVQERDWTSGLCACFNDVLGCFLSYCFPCCFACYIACRLEESCCVPMVVPGGEIAMRTKLRTQNGIRGSICDDCITLYACYPCTLAQMHREIKSVRGGRAI